MSFARLLLRGKPAERCSLVRLFADRSEALAARFFWDALFPVFNVNNLLRLSIAACAGRYSLFLFVCVFHPYRQATYPGSFGDSRKNFSLFSIVLNRRNA